MGRDGSQNWPGINGKPPLKIKASSFELHFHSSDGSASEWGYCLTAKATVSDTSLPPEHIPSRSLWMLRLLAMLNMKAISEVIQNFDWFRIKGFALTLNPLLIDTSLLPPPNDLAVDSARIVVLESTHPYEHNLDSYYPGNIYTPFLYISQ